MKKNSYSALVKLHAVVAAFVLPAAVLFLVTGALYTWGIKGGYHTTTYELRLQEPVKMELAELVALAKKELKKRNVAHPTGTAKIKKIGSSYKLEWTGSNMDVVLEPSSRPLVAKLQVKDTDWHRQFVQLHKAKGGTPFKVYAAVFSIALLALLISGFVMVWHVTELRRLTLLSLVLGAAAFVAMVVTS